MSHTYQYQIIVNLYSNALLNSSADLMVNKIRSLLWKESEGLGLDFDVNFTTNLTAHIPKESEEFSGDAKTWTTATGKKIKYIECCKPKMKRLLDLSGFVVTPSVMNKQIGPNDDEVSMFYLSPWEGWFYLGTHNTLNSAVRFGVNKGLI